MVDEQLITEKYALYNGDCIEVMADLPDASIDLSVYSPPFCGLYHYSSSERDLSNCRSYGEFFDHYRYVVRHLSRLAKPGCFTAVHCMDTPRDGANQAGFIDFPGDIIKLHEAEGWEPWCRHMIWKEPLEVRNRTMMKALAHRQVVDDASLCGVAAADQFILFRRPGERAVPVAYPNGLTTYAGEQQPPSELHRFRGWQGDQKQNRFSHWCWRRYASSVWMDIRLDRTLSRAHREADDEKHMHPLQLDAIERVIVLRSNPGDKVFTPFMGVGSEPYAAVLNGRYGLGVELNAVYYRQALKNIVSALKAEVQHQAPLFDEVGSAIGEKVGA